MPKITPTTEHEHQVSFINWFKREYPDTIIYAIPNGGKRGKLTAFNLKLEGVLAGVPDLFIAKPVSPYAGLYIEMKEPTKGKLGKDQKVVIAQLNDAGYKVEVCYGADEAKKVVDEYFSLA
jgi:hypothetical protein